MCDPAVPVKLAENLHRWTDLEQDSASVYEPLPDDQSIRFLILEPGQRSEPLKGILRVVDISSLEMGNYETLSYVWGTGVGDDQISIDCGGIERAVRITPNLYEALKRLRHPNRKRSLWVDQICIDQENFQERNHQVRFMNLLYKNAGHVIVWLGPDKRSVAESAFKFVHELESWFQDIVKSTEFHQAYTKELETQSRDSWLHLDRLLELEWVSSRRTLTEQHRQPF